MVKRTGPTNPVTTDAIRKMRITKSPIWKKAAETLSKPSRNRPEMNVSRLKLHTEKGDNIVVPGKVLGSGEIDFPVSVAALSFSDAAVRKIEAAGGSTMTIDEMMAKKPKKLRLMK